MAFKRDSSSFYRVTQNSLLVAKTKFKAVSVKVLESTGIICILHYYFKKKAVNCYGQKKLQKSNNI